jgi:hypothetical protein
VGAVGARPRLWRLPLACRDPDALGERISRDAYLATLERLRPLVEQAHWVVPGHGAPIDGNRAIAILNEDVRYLTDWELPLARRTAAQREIHELNRERVADP